MEVRSNKYEASQWLIDDYVRCEVTFRWPLMTVRGGYELRSPFFLLFYFFYSEFFRFEISYAAHRCYSCLYYGWNMDSRIEDR
jgi:hypothetical protein